MLDYGDRLETCMRKREYRYLCHTSGPRVHYFGVVFHYLSQYFVTQLWSANGYETKLFRSLQSINEISSKDQIKKSEWLFLWVILQRCVVRDATVGYLLLRDYATHGDHFVITARQCLNYHHFSLWSYFSLRFIMIVMIRSIRN